MYLLRPLNEQTYAKLADYACGTLKLKKLGLSLVQTSFGPTAQQAINNTLKDYPSCKVVSVQTNSATASDTTQQVLAFKDAGVDGVISANFPNPMGVQVNQMRQNGLTVPYLGGASLNMAKDSQHNHHGSRQPLRDRRLRARPRQDQDREEVHQDYQATYGYPPNYASAQVYDAFHMAANAIEKAGSHDYAKLNKAMASTVYDGVCDYKIDKNNVLANSVTIYKYNSDGSKKLIKIYPLDYVPSDELGPQRQRGPPADRCSPNGGEELPDVVDEEVGLLHRGEVAAARRRGPVRDVVDLLDPRAREAEDLFLRIERDAGGDEHGIGGWVQMPLRRLSQQS